MLDNLAAEQKRARKTNQEMADLLKISRPTYERKKRNGNFSASEAFELCKFFDCTFEYLLQPSS